MKTVSLQMTPAQAIVNAKALDLYARVLMGQFNIVAELFRHDMLVVREPNSPTGGRPVTLEEMDRADMLCDELKRVLGLERGASFGVGSKAIVKEAHRSYEVLCVLQQALAFERSPDGKSVHHDGLRLRYTDEPAPKVSIRENGTQGSASDTLKHWAAKHGVSFVSRSSGQCSTATISKEALLDLAGAMAETASP